MAVYLARCVVGKCIEVCRDDNSPRLIGTNILDNSVMQDDGERKASLSTETYRFSGSKSERVRFHGDVIPTMDRNNRITDT